ncbi:hypothetical protein GW17_00048676 [Ensete ventricosum]|nr:hypothetical protein GW17_00048676 [Ensete ventricosum]
MVKPNCGLRDKHFDRQFRSNDDTDHRRISTVRWATNEDPSRSREDRSQGNGCRRSPPSAGFAKAGKLDASTIEGPLRHQWLLTAWSAGHEPCLAKDRRVGSPRDGAFVAAWEGAPRHGGGLGVHVASS